MGLRHHEAQKLRVGPGGGGAEAAAEPPPQLNGKLGAAPDAGGVQVGPVEDEPPHPLRPAEGKEQGDVSSAAEAQDIRLWDAPGVQKVPEILRERVKGAVPRGERPWPRVSTA